ncbi:MAG: translation initiation factor IF-2 N-terminal domain-containing protein, partial [Chloroflexota bacterium]|nr:translation initiation factor IF-2 N-terminal domain-containing protein [Chloroflexota bacterium]
MRQRSSNRRKSPSAMKKSAPAKTVKVKEEISIPQSLTVKHLADLLGISSIDTIKRLMKKGIMANVNQAIDYDTAASVAIEMGRKPEPEQDTQAVTIEKEEVRITKKEAKAQKPRPPVITILGHVDHGKTSLLDAIRHSHVTDTEAGEITQHIGAYQVTVDGQVITFIDTPGHEAFTTMRARGASITDIAILVVAADDGIMPQTIEAIAHVKSAEVPIVVAINKIDKPNADPERVKQQLAEHNLLIEDWGGEVIAVPVSAKTGEGLQDLLEHLLVVAEVAELKANPSRSASGVVIET